MNEKTTMVTLLVPSYPLDQDLSVKLIYTADFSTNSRHMSTIGATYRILQLNCYGYETNVFLNVCPEIAIVDEYKQLIDLKI